MKRLAWLLLLPVSAGAQVSDPVIEPLDRAYQALQGKRYEEAIAAFLKAVELAPKRASIRKDLAYAYLKVGENEAARDQFGEAMALDSSDFHVALEYGFLCHETRQVSEARRVFDRIRRNGDAASRATAEQAFQNIDRPLAAGSERWSAVATGSPDNFMAHLEVARLAEQRDQLELAAQHYRKAWAILPARKSLLVDLGRVLQRLERQEESTAALLVAWHGGEPRAAEAAREMLPRRFPYVSEFRRAIEMAPRNVELRRDLAYLLLEVGRQPAAEREFHEILAFAPDDLLSCAQLGFLYLARGDRARAMPLLERVLKSSDFALASKVRATLRMPDAPVPAAPPPGPPALSTDPKVMAERSIQAGYLRDAVRYLHLAYEADRSDPWVLLKLGWTYNLLHQDKQAIQWFDLARRSAEPKIAGEAGRAWRNLRPDFARFRTTAWLFPFYSSRWNNVFSYGQVKTDIRLGNLPLRPYVSMRVLGDARRTTGGPFPQYFSESSVIFGTGIASRYWRGLLAWAEAGEAVSYLTRRRDTGRMVPDYRGGVSFARGFGRGLRSGSTGRFYELNADGVFISRFRNDFLVYWQNRLGYSPGPLTSAGVELQVFWAVNITADAKRLEWANFVETGPGVRFRWPTMPRGLSFSVNFLRGTHTLNQHGLRSPNFFDLRVGFWYAITR